MGLEWSEYEERNSKNEKRRNSLNFSTDEGAVSTNIVWFSDDGDNRGKSQGHHSTHNWKLYSTVGLEWSEYEERNSKKEKRRNSSNFSTDEGAVDTKIIWFSGEVDSRVKSQGHYSTQNWTLYSSVGLEWSEFEEGNKEIP